MRVIWKALIAGALASTAVALSQTNSRSGPVFTKDGDLVLPTGFREWVFMGVFRLSWKWRERPTVKITERTLEKRTEVLHRGREGRHPEAAFAGTTAGLEAM